MIFQPTSSLTLAARTFAFKAHAGHVRGNKAQQPYVYHLEEVAALVELSGGDEIAIASGWLHDAVEDTQTSLADIVEHFGPDTGETVDGLTDPVEIRNLPLLERKTLQAMRAHTKPLRVRRVKLADQTSNLRCVALDPPLEWARGTCLEYIEGARRIALVCVGISPYLDEQFQLAYTEALRTHSR